MDLDAIRDWNTHWAGRSVSDLVKRSPHARAAVARMVQEIQAPDDRHWSLRPGPRQVGKTTAMGHTIERLIDQGVPPRSIIYVPADQERVRETCGDSIDDVVTSCLRLHPATVARPLYLFLDEIHAFDAWDTKLKAAWDHYHDRVRVMATGSSALKIGGPADFLNRIRITRMYSMKFREVVEAHPGLREHAGDDHCAELFRRARAARAAIVDGPRAFRAAAEALHEHIHAERGLADFLSHIFEEYCVWGGYPVVRPGTALAAAGRIDHMEAAWNNLVAKDVASAGVTKIREFGLLFRRLASHPGTKFVPNKIAGDIGVKSETVNEWSQLLERLMLIQMLPPLKPNLRPDKGKERVYTLDPAWYAYHHTILDHTRVLGDPGGVIGTLIESVLVDHLRRLQFNIVGTTALKVGYVAKPEIDIAIQLPDRWLLVEAKYRTQPRSNLAEAGHPEDLRIIATRARFLAADTGGVFQIPAHELALLC